MLRKSKILIKWSPGFAYCIGLITTDGNLSPDNRHINLTSKDVEIIKAFKEILKLSNKIGKKSRAKQKEKNYYVIQFGDKNFYEFLNSIGIQKRKSKTIKSIDVPNEYFRDFLRGCIDGDGNISLFSHKESKNIQLKIRLVSASRPFLDWIIEKIKINVGSQGGWISKAKSGGVYSLSYGKTDSIGIIDFMYYDALYPHLKRKCAIAKGTWRNWYTHQS